MTGMHRSRDTPHNTLVNIMAGVSLRNLWSFSEKLWHTAM